MLRRSARCGIKLVSVLVVIAGIVVLFSLVPPAIQSARETARRNECSNQLRQIVAGLANYHDAHTTFPMGAMHSGPNPGGNPPITAGLGPSWWFGILPLMDQRGGPKVVVTHVASVSARQTLGLPRRHFEHHDHRRAIGLAQRPRPG